MTENRHTVGAFTYGANNIRLIDYNPESGAKVTIGKFCSIAEGQVWLLNAGHRVDWVTTYPFGHVHLDQFPSGKVHGSFGHPFGRGDIVVGNDVWFGHSCMVLDGVSIGHGAVIAAKSLVNCDVPPYAIFGGVPARFIRYRFEPQIIEALLSLSWWDLPVATIDAIIPLLQDSAVEKNIADIQRIVKGHSAS